MSRLADPPITVRADPPITVRAAREALVMELMCDDELYCYEDVDGNVHPRPPGQGNRYKNRYKKPRARITHGIHAPAYAYDTFGRVWTRVLVDTFGRANRLDAVPVDSPPNDLIGTYDGTPESSAEPKPHVTFTPGRWLGPGSVRVGFATLPA